MNDGITCYGYWKGTGLGLPKEAFANILRVAHQNQLDDHHFLKEKLDAIEADLRTYYKRNPIGYLSGNQMKMMTDIYGSDGMEKLGEWFLCIALLLEMKVIQNDEMTGWLMLEKKGPTFKVSK